MNTSRCLGRIALAVCAYFANHTRRMALLSRGTNCWWLLDWDLFPAGSAHMRA
jgi:hypothetical protein